MAENEESLENTLKSVKGLINSGRVSATSNEEILELTEDDLFDEEDLDHQEHIKNQKKSKKDNSINQLLTPMVNNINIGLEQVIAESLKPYLKEWINEIVSEAVQREFNKHK